MTEIAADLVCFSHLRWSFVFQRPQHLLSRFAKVRKTYFWEEPVYEDGEPHVRSYRCEQTGVWVLTPIIPLGLRHDRVVEIQKSLLDSTFREHGIDSFIAWYYAPMAMEFSSSLEPVVTVYDCMDELSHFAGAPPQLAINERKLFDKADLVFTGGASLYASKRNQHRSVHLFPSSVDTMHFQQARSCLETPADQAAIPAPRLGYAGVIDERMDLALVEAIAARHPDWHFVFLGPVVKIDPASLPCRDNIHFLGMKAYSELPAYFSGWRIGMLPFALNDATRYISPTKTPEYLAAGLRVISSPICDVISPYQGQGLVGIAHDNEEFGLLAEAALADSERDAFLTRVDRFLSLSSWDKTWREMAGLVDTALSLKARPVSSASIDMRGDAVRV